MYWLVGESTFSFMADNSQQFLRDLDKKLWTAADRLRANLDAAVYKHAVLGLIFLKYISDSFTARQRRSRLSSAIRRATTSSTPPIMAARTVQTTPRPSATNSRSATTTSRKMSFGCPHLPAGKRCRTAPSFRPARRSRSPTARRAPTRLAPPAGSSTTHSTPSSGRTPKLKGVLNKTYTQLQLDPANLSSLIDLIATIPFEHAELNAKDILGHVYEYFLGQFALAEGKKGGQYFTPKSIVSLIVEMLEPYQGRVYDPAMGSGGFFVQSEKFIEEHGGRLGNLSVYGQESNPTTWRLAAMNMAIRGIDFNFGKEPANSFTNDQHPDLRADYVMANPPFNMSEWWDAKLEGDPRWR